MPGFGLQLNEQWREWKVMSDKQVCAEMYREWLNKADVLCVLGICSAHPKSQEKGSTGCHMAICQAAVTWQC